MSPLWSDVAVAHAAKAAAKARFILGGADDHEPHVVHDVVRASGPAVAKVRRPIRRLVSSFAL